jgi:hypothetical protein
MFAYNPTVQDRSGELIAQGMNNASAMQMEGMQNFGQGLGQGLSSLGSTYADSMSKARENAAKANTNLGVGEAIASIYRTYGTPEQYQDYITGLDRHAKDQDKLSGYNSVHVQTANALMDMARTQSQAAAYLDLARQKAALGGGTSGTAASTGLTYQF